MINQLGTFVLPKTIKEANNVFLIIIRNVLTQIWEEE